MPSARARGRRASRRLPTGSPTSSLRTARATMEAPRRRRSQRIRGGPRSRGAGYARAMAWTLRGACCCALLLVSAGARAGPLDDARELLRDDRPAAAAGRMAAHVRERPDDVDAWAVLGEAERKRCRLGLARAAFARALEIEPADPAARAGLAEAWLQSGEADEALAAAQAGIDAA